MSASPTNNTKRTLSPETLPSITRPRYTNFSLSSQLKPLDTPLGSNERINQTFYVNSQKVKSNELHKSAINEGLSMLEAVEEKRKTDKQLKLLENRVQRLEYEEERAKKKLEETKKKTEVVVKIKERHQRDIDEKLKLQQKMREDEQTQRERNSMIKQGREMTIRGKIEELMNMNKNAGEFIKESSRINTERKNIIVEEDYLRKKEMNVMQSTNFHQNIERKYSKNAEQLLNLKLKFFEKIAKNKKQAIENMGKMKPLETKEEQLINKLSATAELHKMHEVQLAHIIRSPVNRETSNMNFGSANISPVGRNYASVTRKQKSSRKVSSPIKLYDKLKAFSTVDEEIEKIRKLEHDEMLIKNEMQELKKQFELGPIIKTSSSLSRQPLLYKSSTEGTRHSVRQNPKSVTPEPLNKESGDKEEQEEGEDEMAGDTMFLTQVHK